MSRPLSAWERCLEFNGRACPGPTIGFMACEAAMTRRGPNFARDEGMVCITDYARRWGA
ncbi:MAG: hypothetical protein ACYC2W_00660 [Desulfurivibrionaceae bacterium]